MTSHAPESRLIDLASGLLSDEEARELIQHIGQCSACEARLRTVVADRESARSGPVPKLRYGRIQLGPGPRPSILVRASLVVAACALVALGVFLATHRNDGPPEYWIPVTNETTLLHRGNEQGGVTDVLKSYRDHDAATAIKELQALTFAPGDETASTLRNVYLASALANAGRAEEALEVLGPTWAIEFLPTPWRFHAQWVRYVALLRADKEQEANDLLEKLAEEPGAMGEKAREEIKHRR